MDTMTGQRLEVVLFINLCIYSVCGLDMCLYNLWEWVVTVWEAGIYTEHTFFLKMPNFSSVLHEHELYLLTSFFFQYL